MAGLRGSGTSAPVVSSLSCGEFVPRRHRHTAPKYIWLTDDARDAIQHWSKSQGISFSAGIETLARIGLGQPLDTAMAPALVSVVRVEVQRQMHRLASLPASNAIEAGVAARLSRGAPSPTAEGLRRNQTRRAYRHRSFAPTTQCAPGANRIGERQ
jgi:hypothetical protein